MISDNNNVSGGQIRRQQIEPAIKATNIGKCYPIYDKPFDRLKQAVWPGKRKFYKEFWALSDLSVEIGKKETVGIIGSNGSGKSTLLQLICGTVKPTTGELRIHGRVSALLELGAGFNPEFSGRENIFLNASVMGLSVEETEKRFADIVAFADIGDFLDRPVKTYSSGMYVRLAFAVAVNVSPDILLIDEALSVGDARFQQKCMAQIRRFCENGTVIFVSHDTSAITELCTRTIWLKDGRIKMDSSPKKVVEAYLQYMYEGEVRNTTVPKSSETDSGNPARFDNFLPVANSDQQFGNNHAVIEYARFSTADGNSAVAHSGSYGQISLIVKVNHTIENPIIGYLVRDRLGREIFGDNTGVMKYPSPTMVSGNRYLISFDIAAWPNIIEGEYLISLAVAEGTVEDHVQCHWAYDVIVLKSVPLRPPMAMFSVSDTEVSVESL